MKTNSMRKKVLSIVLAMAMIVSMFPAMTATVNATDAVTETTVEETAADETAVVAEDADNAEEAAVVSEETEVVSEESTDVTESTETTETEENTGTEEGTETDETVTETSAFESGTGTAEDPYVIANAAQLKVLADKVNGGDTCEGEYFQLSADIDLAELVDEEGSQIAWTPIGGGEAVATDDEEGYDQSTPSLKFKGTFDGNGKTIKNLLINADADFTGLFGHNGGTVKNFTLEGKVTVTGEHDYVAAVAAFNSGTITGVINKAEISAADSYNVGGIAGTNVAGNWKYKGSGSTCHRTAKDAVGVITKCGNEGKITALRTVGGIVGSNFGEVSYCYNYGDIDFLWEGSMSKIGGIAGVCADTDNATFAPGNIFSCYNTGYIQWTNTVQSSKGYGGIVCFIGGTSSIVNCYNIGEMKKGRGDQTPICPRYDSTKYISNNYSLDTLEITYMEDLQNVYLSGTQKSEEEFKSAAFLTEIGGAYEADKNNINNGYPVLKWQNGTDSTISKIEIDTSEVTTDYTEGQTVTTTGMAAYAVYSDGTKELIPATYYSTDKTEALTTEDDGTMVNFICTVQGVTGTAGVTIDIGIKQLDKIQVSTNPTKYTYKSGETFDATGMKVRAYYNNDNLSSSEKYSVIEDYEITAPETLTPSNNKITLSYTLNGTTKKETFTVKVLDQSNAPAQDEKGVYQLTSAADLIWFANEVSYFGNTAISGVLVNDIDVSGTDFVPIGCSSLQSTQESGVNKVTITYKWTNAFKGTLDGNGKTVTMNMEGTQYMALVGNASGATVKNVTTAGTVTGSGNYIAGVVAYCDSATVISGCTNTADITNTNNYTGGINARGANTVENCTNTGDVTSTSSNVGGIVGYGANTAVITGCTNTGDISAVAYVGGIVGRNFKSIDGCINSGDITATGMYAAGISAYGYTSSAITNSANTGTVQAGSAAAGIVSNGKVINIENCYNTGDVTATAATATAGAAGIMAVKDKAAALAITNCYNTGNVTLGEDSAETAVYGDMVANANVSSDAYIVTITNSYYLAGDSKFSIGTATDGYTNVDVSQTKTLGEFSALAATLGEAYKDSCCGPVFTTQNVTDHNAVSVASKDATCVEDGLKEGSYCDVCSMVLEAQEVIPATGHTEVTDAAVEGSCTVDAVSEGSHCSVCGTITKTQVITKAPGHTEVIDEAVAAGCKTDGLTEGSHCSVCNEVLTAQEAVPATGHDVVTDEAVAAGCETTGLTEGFHCSVCEAVIVAQEVVPATGHDWVVDGKAPTCTEDGYGSSECKNCDAEIVGDTIPALGHYYDYTVTKAATCTEDGEKEGKCTRTGCDNETTEKIAATGHQFVTYVDNKDATCEKDGTATATCENGCGTTEDKVVNALGHLWQTDSDGNPVYTVDKKATCAESGLESIHCERCNDTKNAKTIAATGHKEVKDAAVAATCTTDGLTEGSHCFVCNEVLTAQQVIPAAGHDAVTDAAVAATCTTDGLTEGSHCSVCNTVLTAQKTVSATGHAWESTYTVDKAATFYKPGSKSIHCANCDAKDSVTKIVRIKKVTANTLVYNGKNRTQNVTVVDYNGKKLVKGKDFTVTYKNAKGTKVVTPNAVGTYKAVIKFKGNYSGADTRIFKINPKATYITKNLTKNGKKQFTVKWAKRTAQVTGYQICYSTSKTFKTKSFVKVKNNKTTVKTIKGLKSGKRYYVKVRTYKTVNGVTYYSAWSKVKNTKVK